VYNRKQNELHIIAQLETMTKYNKFDANVVFVFHRFLSFALDVVFLYRCCIWSCTFALLSDSLQIKKHKCFFISWDLSVYISPSMYRGLLLNALHIFVKQIVNLSTTASLCWLRDYMVW